MEFSSDAKLGMKTKITFNYLNNAGKMNFRVAKPG